MTDFNAETRDNRAHSFPDVRQHFGKRTPQPATASASNEIFTDITEQAGITWQQFGGESSDQFLIETMGGGVGFFDFDNDGLLDTFFVNGGETAHGKSPIPLSNAL